MPGLWADDALQDVKIALWRQADRNPKTVIRSAAVDAARRYGPHSRHGLDRTTYSLDALYEERPSFDVPSPVPVVPDYDAIRKRSRAVMVLDENERELLLRFLRPHARFSDREHSALQRVRQQLRAQINPPDRPMRLRRVCQCGVTFWTNYPRQRACTAACREMYDARAGHPKPEGRCEFCKKPLVYPDWNARAKRFCERRCAVQFRRGRKISDFKKACIGCGERFTAGTMKRVYCSHGCYVKHWYRRKRAA